MVTVIGTTTPDIETLTVPVYDPTDKLFAPFDAYLEAYHALVADFSDDERRDLFGRNANRIYRLGLDL